ncbi:MAG: fibronectin type III domain-containing protein [Dehalococcoidia bacterium]
MLTIHALIRRLTVTVGLAAALLTSATLLGPAATADPGPGGVAVPGIPFTAAPNRPLQVEAWGTSARVHVTSAEPALFSVTLTPAHGITTTPSAYDDWGPVTPTLKTDHVFTLADLRSNTAYTLEVTATTAFGQTLSHAASFTTAKLRARLTLDKIVVHDDGDWIGKGEPTWFWSMTWDKLVGGGVIEVNGERTGGCYPYRSLCEPGSTGEGTLYPTNPKGEKLALLFAEENFPVMPDRFTLGTRADESDWPHPCLPCEFQPGSVETLHVPTGSEGSVREIAIPARGDGVESTMYFRFETFHDTLPYPPNRGSTRVHFNY